MILNFHYMAETPTGNEAPHSKDQIRTRFAALLGAAAILTGGCSADETATPVGYVPSIEAPENVRTATIEDIRAELTACVDEAIEVSTEPDGSVDTDFLDDMKGVCVEIAEAQVRTEQSKAHSAELTENIIASLELGGSK